MEYISSFESTIHSFFAFGSRLSAVAVQMRNPALAPTKFGAIDFEFRRNGSTLTLDYQFVRGAHQQMCRQVQLHIPPSTEQAESVRINGKDRALQPHQDVIQLE